MTQTPQIQPAQIKQMRQRAGFTQEQLANAAHVSQSLVAKIERGSVDPLFSTMQKLLSVLEQYKSPVPSIQKLICKDVFSCSISESIDTALARLKSKSCSQLPVFDKKIVVGIVNESSLLGAMLEKKKSLSDAMLPPPPIISLQTPPQLISDILRSTELVLVSDKGNICGVISRADLLRELSKAI